MSSFNVNVSSSVIEESIAAKDVSNFKQKAEFDVKNYLNTKLEPHENNRKVVIRILPVSTEDGNFRIAIKTHNLKVSKKIANSGFKSFLCLNDPQVPNYDTNKSCPICSKAEEYFSNAKACMAEDKDKSKKLFVKGCSLKCKTTYIVRVIERGKEHEGVKFWRFNENTQGKGIYDSLIALYKQRKDDMEEAGVENYNIFDLNNGRDIVIDLTRTKRSDGQEGIATIITDKSINTPLTKDLELGNSWINDTKKWYDAYASKPHEYLEIIAEDKIPFFDKSLGTFVGKTEEDLLRQEQSRIDFKKNQEANDQMASEVLKFNAVQVSDDIDLPF